MGISFPLRPLRSAFGPKLENAYPVENSNTQIGDGSFNAAFWALAGLGLVLPRVVVVAKWTGSSFTIFHQAEAWNPDGAQAHPVLARSATGRYSYTFASTYLDEDGVAQDTVLRAARCTAGDDNGGSSPRRGYAWILSGTPLVVNFRVDNDALVGQDELFWLEVL